MKQRSEKNTALTNQITILEENRNQNLFELNRLRNVFEENRNQNLFELNRLRNESISTSEKLVTAETTCIEKLNESNSKRLHFHTSIA